MTNAPARTTPATVDRGTYVREQIEKQDKWLAPVLATANVDPKRFQLIAITAVKANPQLMECFTSREGEISFLLALKEAAEVGLEPNTPLQECWLLPRRRGQVMECQLSIGYIGEMKLARRSGEIKTIFADVVREGDQFQYARGAAEDVFEHTPGPSDQRGELTHAYAVARYINGGYNFVVLDKAQVEERRAMSDSWKGEKSRPYSPWTNWTEAMWRKSAIRALRPYLPLTAATARVLANDERTLTIDDAEGIIEARTGDTIADPKAGEVLVSLEAGE